MKSKKKAKRERQFHFHFGFDQQRLKTEKREKGRESVNFLNSEKEKSEKGKRQPHGLVSSALCWQWGLIKDTRKLAHQPTAKTKTKKKSNTKR